MKKIIIQRKKFYKNYLDAYNSVFTDNQLQKISVIQDVIEKKIRENKFIFVCGNGGSGAIANHFLCDFNKGIKETSKKKLLPKVISLSSNTEVFSAISNDYSYYRVFKDQLENYSSKGDCLVTMSCSGNSKNILEIIKYAKSKKIFIISLSGFNNGSFLKKNCNIHFNAGIKNYGVSEDIFQTIMHMISQNIRSKFKTNFKKNFL